MYKLQLVNRAFRAFELDIDMPLALEYCRQMAAVYQMTWRIIRKSDHVIIAQSVNLRAKNGQAQTHTSGE